MTTPERRVGDYMSKTALCIALEADLEEAVRMMQEHGFRHLPVMDGDKLVGVVSDRDLAIVESLLPGEWERICVAEAMTPEPYCVTPDAALWKVARHMAQMKFGCAVVTDPGGAVLGLFTTTDALKVLADVARADSEG